MNIKAIFGVILIAILYSCQSKPKEEITPHLPSLEEIKQRREAIKEYTHALASLDTQDQVLLQELYKVLFAHCDRFFPQDRPLLEASINDPNLRKELAEKGKIFVLLENFEAFEPAVWQKTRKELEKYGSFALECLAEVLSSRLLDMYYSPQWYFIRTEIANLGEVGLEYSLLFAKALIEKIDEKSLKHPYEEPLTQFIIILMMYGEKARPQIMEFASHPNKKIRSAVARAIGELKDITFLQTCQKLLLQDPAWEVRAYAAEAIANLPSEEVPETLSQVLNKEDDITVFKRALSSLVKVKGEKATVDLINLLQRFTMEDKCKEIINTLNNLHGKRFKTKQDWFEWWKLAGMEDTKENR